MGLCAFRLAASHRALPCYYHNDLKFSCFPHQRAILHIIVNFVVCAQSWCRGIWRRVKTFTRV